MKVVVRLISDYYKTTSSLRLSSAYATQLAKLKLENTFSKMAPMGS